MSIQGHHTLYGFSWDHNTRYRRVHIPFAQVRTLRATPKVIIPAHGAWKVSKLITGMIRLVAGGVAYTESVDNLVLRYTDGSGVVISDVIEMTGFITQTVNTHTGIRPAVDGIVVGTSAANQPIVLHNNGDGEFGNSGTGELTVHVTYQVFDIR